jgi:hypothetical protein
MKEKSYKLDQQTNKQTKENERETRTHFSDTKIRICNNRRQGTRITILESNPNLTVIVISTLTRPNWSIKLLTNRKNTNYLTIFGAL